MKKNCAPLFLCMAMIATSALAQSSYYCPWANGYTSVGSTMDQVRASCGEPSSTDSQEKRLTKEVPAEQWYYRFTGADTVDEGDFQAVLSFRDNKLYNIDLGGKGVASLSFCRGSVQSGDNAMKVIAACGRPSLLNKTTETISLAKQKVTTWTYAKDQYAAPVVFTFDQNGVLISIE